MAYSKKVMKYFLHPKNVGEIKKADGIGEAGNLACGDIMQIYIKVSKNKKGEPAHTEADGSDWSLSEWCNAVLGELGEAANIIKKVRRGGYTLDEKRKELGKEYADVVCYLDLLAYRTGIDLGRATVDKWNEISERIDCNLRITHDDDWYRS